MAMAVLANVRLDWNVMPETNTLAYSDPILVTKKKKCFFKPWLQTDDLSNGANTTIEFCAAKRVTVNRQIL